MKAYTIDNFKSRLTNGLAKSNLWRVEIPTSGISNDISMETLNFMCKSIQLPGRQILTADKLVGMFNEKVAYGFAVPDVNLNFHVTNDYTVKRFFEAWQRASVNTGSTGAPVTPEIGFKKDYVRDVVIRQLAPKRGIAKPEYDPVYSCKLIDAFPTSLNAIELNNEQNGLVEVSVQLSYTDWSEI